MSGLKCFKHQMKRLRCRLRVKPIVLIGCLASHIAFFTVAMVATIVFLLMFEPMFIGLVHENLRLLPNSTLHKILFSGKPSTEEHAVYLFNLTNPTEMLKGDKPRLKQVGPFFFRVEAELVFHEFSRGTRPKYLEYSFRHHFFFEPKNSHPSYQTEKLVIPNIMHQGIVNNRLKQNYPNPFISLTPEEALWGFKIVVYATSREVGLLSMFNASRPALYVIETGEADVRRTGTLVSIDNKRIRGHFENEEADLVRGRIGHQTSPQATVGDTLDVMSKATCRPLRLVATGMQPSRNHDGIKLLSFKLPPSDQSDPATHWAERKYCVKSHECGPRGLINLGCHRKAMRGLQVYASLPFFLNADPRLKDKFEFLDSTDPKEHDMELNVEPFTGLTMEALHRYQYNVFINNNIEVFKNTSGPFYFPLLWNSRTILANHSTLEKIRTEVLERFEKIPIYLKALTGIFASCVALLTVFLVLVIVFRNHGIFTVQVTQRTSFDQECFAETPSTETMTYQPFYLLTSKEPNK